MSALRKLALFLTAAIVLTCGLHLVVDAGMRRVRYGAVGAFNRIADGRVNADIVITGSSRAYVQYDPDIIQAATHMTTFNAGRDGSNTIIHAGVLRYYLSHNRKPRLIIENADPHSLGYGYDLYEPAQYVPYLHDQAFYSVVKRMPILQKAYYLPLYGYVVDDVEFAHYLGLKALFGIQPIETVRNGYQPVNHGYSDGLWRRWVDKNQKTITFALLPYCMEEMGWLLEDARSRGIPCIIVFSPVYHERLVAIKNRSSIVAKLAQVARQHGALLWDLSDLSPVSENKDNFADWLHMNKQGATLFSKILGQRLAAWLGSSEFNLSR